MATVSVTLVTADSRDLLHHTQYLPLLLRVRDCERDEQPGKLFR